MYRWTNKHEWGRGSSEGGGRVVGVGSSNDPGTRRQKREGGDGNRKLGT